VELTTWIFLLNVKIFTKIIFQIENISNFALGKHSDYCL
jgi:hypothetical protein